MADELKPNEEPQEANGAPNADATEPAVEPEAVVSEEQPVADTAESVQADKEPEPSAEELAEDHTKAELQDAARAEGVPVSGTKDEVAERLVEAEVHVPTEQERIAALPPTLQAEAAGKTVPHEETPLYERQVAKGEETPLQQRPVDELSGHQAEQNVLTDDGTTITPGSYHKPGAALPPETEDVQQPAPQAEAVEKDHPSTEDVLAAQAELQEDVEEFQRAQVAAAVVPTTFEDWRAAKQEAEV